MSIAGEPSSRVISSRHWKSVEQWENGAEFRRNIGNEFETGVMEPDEGFSRRTFLKTLAAAMAAAELAGCKPKVEESIVPYVRQPAGTTPGRPLYFATTMTLSGYAQGVIATSREGKPVKLDGNPDHPANLGASDVYLQGALLDLYDPDRSQVVARAGTISEWDAFIGVLRPKLDAWKRDGSRLAILTETITSPTLLGQIAQMKRVYPGAKWFGHDPLSRENMRRGLQSAGVGEAEPVIDFSKAETIVSLDCDFLGEEPGHSRNARDFIDGRRIKPTTTRMNRLYIVESTNSITGTMADHRWAVKPSKVGDIATALLTAVGGEEGAAAPAERSTDENTWVTQIAADLRANRGRCVVVAGSGQSSDVHAAAAKMNQILGNVNQTVRYVARVDGRPDGTLNDLALEMDRGDVDGLIILGGNPCYGADADVRFDAALEAFSNQVDRNLTVRLGTYDDETSAKCQWQLPQSHFLEEWGDARAYEGTISLVQPLITGLYTGRSAVEVMDLLLNGYLRTGREIVWEAWAAQHRTGQHRVAQHGLVQDGVAQHGAGAQGTSQAASQSEVGQTGAGQNAADQPGTGDFDTVWRRSLERGIWLGNFSEAASINGSGGAASASGESASVATKQDAAGAEQSDGGFELVFRPDPSAWDGCYANNAFLQELPKPLTKLTWDNAALISVNSAEKIGVTNGQMLQIKSGERTLDIPAWIVPGLPDATVTLHLGYGRWRGGKVGTGIGFNAYKLRTSHQRGFTRGAVVRRIEGDYPLAATHTHQTIAQRHEGDLDAKVIQRPGDEEIDNRKLVRVGTLKQFVDDPDFVKKLDEPEKKNHLTLYPGYQDTYKNNLAWGMSIDLQSCIGCNACVIACQAENNISVVGKDQVSRGREMHWIRIDTYYEGNPESPAGAFHQPVPCQQCENAPCELVCPVGATVHDNEGINDMVYNRCVGTRYCSNNCPYKVRRFNFLPYSDEKTESLKLMRNPEVTVRSRGVMEKCSYCIQRITATRIDMEIIQVQADDEARKASSPREAAEIQRKSAETRQKKLDGLQSACQQACPTRAIIFGNLNARVDPIHNVLPDHLSEAAQLKRHPLDYSLLADLTTQPRTTYLARIQNPNPAITNIGRAQ